MMLLLYVLVAVVHVVSSPNISLLCLVVGDQLVDVVVKCHLCQQLNKTQREVITARRDHLFSSRAS
jgi:hypothetical protein